MAKIALTVLGAGNMGTAVAEVLAHNGYDVKIWNFEGDPEPLKAIAESHENKKYFPGLKLSPRVRPEPDLQKAVQDTAVVFVAIPSAFFAATLSRAVRFMKKGVVCVSLSKGLDEKKMFFLSQVLDDEIKKIGGKSVVLSGPAIAKDLGHGHFTAMNIAGKDSKTVQLVSKLLQNDYLKLVPSRDVIGVQLGGACKNVYALILGICDGLEMPMNTKAVLVVSALQEMGELMKALGGKKETVYELAGVGDLIGTSFSLHSRNRRCGEYVGKGKKIKEAVAEVGQVVEGIQAVKLILKLGRKKKIKLPLAETVERVVVGGRDAREELTKFLRKSF
ncbi:MAG TPA: NAD(P)H-dependent glycerol-3-phosphate dehydrogenase [Patescibacteria group bacterium]|nr:NAD(P)H-dependent glycerol-3-phosphate dehydrogenase [Patescibacteria group bacterium]